MKSKRAFHAIGRAFFHLSQDFFTFLRSGL